MNFTKIADLIKHEAPLLASVISTANPVAGIFVNILMSIFGANDENTLANSISIDPDASVKIKKIESDHSENLLRITNDDIGNARQREIEFTKITGKKDWVVSLFSITFLLGFFVFIFLNLLNFIPQDNESHTIFDTLSNITCLIVSYYFGSCHPSNR